MKLPKETKPKKLRKKKFCVLSESTKEKTKLSTEDLEHHLDKLTRLGTYQVGDAAANLVDPSVCMKRHEKLKCQVMRDFLACLGTYGNDKWTDLLQNVDFTVSDGTKEEVPMILVVCSGEPNNSKVGIANKALIDWNLVTKKKIGKNQCEF